MHPIKTQHKTRNTNSIRRELALNSRVSFLNRTPKAQVLKSIFNKWNLLKLETFCKEELSLEQNGSLQIGKRSSPNPTFYKVLISKIYKELKKLDIKKTNNPIKTWAIELNRILKRRNSNGPETLNEMFNMLSLQGNAY